MSDALRDAIDRFATTVGEDLAALAGASGMDTTRVHQDVLEEAVELVEAFIDADAHHTDAELVAYLEAVGSLLSGRLARATPEGLGRVGLLNGARRRLTRPSRLFELLVRADRGDRGGRGWRYLTAAVGIGHTVAALDLQASRTELDAIERFRAMLLRALADAGVPHPSSQRPDGGFFAGSPPSRSRPSASAVEELLELQRSDHPQPRPTRPSGDEPPAGADLPPPRELDEVIGDLEALIGLDAVKAEVELVADLLVVQRLREERGLPTVPTSRHLVFTGNPGTGKTTVARLVADIYRSLGLLSRGQLVETDRSGLVAGYVGQTAERTRQVAESALDGVLLVDEAYALARGEERDFGQEAIDTLVKMMEDHRDRLVVIVTGYPEEMATFIEANPGLSSRFPRTIHFPDYATVELVDIAEHLAVRHGYRLDEGAAAGLERHLAGHPRERGFGNGRFVRNLFEAAITRHASRLVQLPQPTDEDLVTLTAADIEAAVGDVA